MLHRSKIGLYLLAASAFALSCKPPLTYELQLEQPMPDGAKQVILEAVADWQTNVPALIVNVVPAHGGCALATRPCITVAAVDDALLDGTDSADRYIVYSTRLSRADAGHLLRHRLGHMFELPHARWTVMDDNPATWAYVVTPEDTAAFYAVRR